MHNFGYAEEGQHERVGDARVGLELGRVGHHLAPHGVAALLDQAGVIRRDLDLEDLGDAADLLEVEAELRGDVFGLAESPFEQALPVVHLRTPNGNTSRR